MDLLSMDPAFQVAHMSARAYQRGLCAAFSGSISTRDENGNVWITPACKDLSALSREDIVSVSKSQLENVRAVDNNIAMHYSIYAVRPNIQAVIHAFPPYLMAYGSMGKLPNISFLPSSKYRCETLSFVHFGSMRESLNDRLMHKAQLGHDCLLIENGGVVVIGEDLETAFLRLDELEAAAKLNFVLSAIGKPVIPSEKHMTMYMLRNFPHFDESAQISDDEQTLSLRKNMIDKIERLYQKNLFTPSSGTLSYRVDEDRFLITPYGKDRFYLSEEDLILIDKGKRECNKIPSRSAELCMHIYRKNPDIGCILIAQPPYLMSFAVTETNFEPARYAAGAELIGNLKRLPFGASFMQPELTAKEVHNQASLLISENDSIVVCGANAEETFARLEWSENLAQSICVAKQLDQSDRLQSN